MSPKTNEIVSEKIHSLPVEPKQSKPRSPTDPIVKYFEIPLRFEAEENIKDVFNLEFPMVTCAGIVERREADGRINYSVQVRFPLDVPEVKKFVDKWNNVLYPRLCQIIVDSKRHLGTTPLSVTMDTIIMIFKNPMYYPIDKLSGERIPGRDPSMFIKLFSYNDGKYRTNFFDIEKEVMEWKSMSGDVTVDFAPIVQLKKIYFGGGKLSLQMEMREALVTAIRKQRVESSQSELVDKFVKANPNAIKDWHDQIAFLTESTPTSADVKSKATSSPTDEKEAGVENSSSYKDFLNQAKGTPPSSPTESFFESKSSEPKSPETKKTKPVVKKKIVKAKVKAESDQEAESDNEEA